MAVQHLEFEKPIESIESELTRLEAQMRKKTDALIEKLRKERAAKANATPSPAASDGTEDSSPAIEPPPEPKPEEVDPLLATQIQSVHDRLAKMRAEIYSNLTPWQRVQIARHPARPHTLDYIHRLFSDWTELAGDRHFGDDKSVVTGFGRFNDQPVAIIGQQKGADTKDNILRNFGMMHPEGYRKAMRVMKLAEKFSMPVIVLIDTPGAYPGIGAEERGQGEAIGRNIMEMALLGTPIICLVIGEGASGGALGIGIGDRLLMMEYSWYCVISPEGCASILWRDPLKAPDAAQALKITAQDLLELGVIDEIVPEPLGGAHHDPGAAAQFIRAGLARHLDELRAQSPEALLERRYQKYRTIGNEWIESLPVPEPAAEPAAQA